MQGFNIDAPEKYWQTGEPMLVHPYPSKKGGWFLANDEAEFPIWYWILVSMRFPVRLDKPKNGGGKKWVSIVVEVAEEEDAQRILNGLLDLKKMIH